MRRFLPFDISAFKPHTWGALGLCYRCKQRPAKWMREHAAGRKRTPTYLPFCDFDKRKLEEVVTEYIKQEERAMQVQEQEASG